MDQKTYVSGFHNNEAVKKMKYKPLGSTGLYLSEISLGCGPLGGMYEAYEQAEGIKVVKEAIASGINYLDTAPWYGQGKSEEVLGMALKNIPRSAYYIGTKVGRYETDVQKMFDFSASKVAQSFEESLAKLGLDYVDIIQVHDIEFAENLEIIVNETLPALQKIVAQGKAKFIGITAYPLTVLKEVYDKSTVKIDSILTYCRNTLFDDELENYIPFFKENQVGIINAGIFSMGLLVDQGPQSWHPAPQYIKEGCKNATLFCEENDASISSLAIKHSLSTEGVTTHLLGMTRLVVLRNNIEAAVTPLTDEEKIVIRDIKKKYFSDFPQKNWEKVEEEKYWKQKKAGSS